MYTHLFSPIEVGGLKLENRITMAPLYLGYAGKGGTVSPLLLEHYRLMGASGAAMITVENATVDHPHGSGSDRTLRLDTDHNLDGLRDLIGMLRAQNAKACIQLNHAGRFAGAAPEPVAPSAVETFGFTPRALSLQEIEDIQAKFAAAAKRAKQAGFDLLELHGGTGYLLAQFVSPRTNKRTDAYGGSLQNRMRFPLEVLQAVQEAAGDLPVGYRFMADEFLPDGLRLEESVQLAQALDKAGAAYLSVMGGTYESFTLPEIVQKSKTFGYMADLAQEVKKQVQIPVITAGRISAGEVAEGILAKGQADLIGLARVLWADPQWPQKVYQGREQEIIHCDPDCEDVCMQLVMQGKPAFCPQWPPEKTRHFKELFK
jgi:2,4-dienoyl-CoA reductase (NADPH2)